MNWLAVDYILKLHEYDEDELVDLGFAIAEGIVSKEYISRWIKQHKVNR